MQGHLWTAYGHLVDRFRPPSQPGEAWSCALDDPTLGRVILTGVLVRRGPELVVLVHGLGGEADSGYVIRAARYFETRGYSTLRMSLRGADRSGEDFYHAGLTADLRAALSSPEVESFERVVVVGFSMGGHISLRLAAEGDHPASAVAAICAPLDLGASGAVIDRPRSLPYRRHLLRGLKEMYREVARRRPAAFALGERDIAAIRTLRGWDAQTIVPRFGFDDVDDYYHSCSAGPLLGAVDLPTLYLTTDADPMVTAETLVHHLARRSRHVEVRWLPRGGHVAFSSGDRVYDQLLGWLGRAGR